MIITCRFLVLYGSRRDMMREHRRQPRYCSNIQTVFIKALQDNRFLFRLAWTNIQYNQLAIQ